MRVAELTPTALVDLTGAAIAPVWGANPLAGDPTGAARAIPGEGGPVIAWSGGLGPGLFERHPATWMPAGRDAWTRFLDAAEPELARRGGRLLVRPHARHVVSDVTAAASMLAGRDPARLGVALDPAACFEATMLPDAEDHLRRMFRVLGASAEVVILRSLPAAPAGGDGPGGPPLEPLPLGEGATDPALLGALVREYVGERTVVAVSGPDPAGQLAGAGLL